MRFFTLSLIVAIISLIYALPSYASPSSQNVTEEPGFTITVAPTSDSAVTTKGYFVYKLKNSTTITGSVLLKNPGNKMLTIELAAVDAITAQKGGSAFETADVKPKLVATWLKFAESSVTLQAGTQKPVDFTVTVPQSVKPGQYLAGISAYVPTIPPTTDPRTSGQLGAGVILQTRYVIGVQVDVEGAWNYSLKIESAGLVQEPSGPYIGVQMRNDGDTFLKPSGTVVLTDTTGKRVLEQPITMGTFVPGTGVTYPVKWSGELKPGDYQVSVEMKYAAENATTRIARYDGPLKIEAASKGEAPTQTVPGQQPGTISEGQPQPATLGSSDASVPGNSPSDASNIGNWLIVIFSGLSLSAALVLTLTILQARCKSALPQRQKNKA